MPNPVAVVASNLPTAVAAVLAVMQDGKWHSLEELAQLTGFLMTGCSARLRDLRKEKYGSHKIELSGNEGQYLYRLVK